jgi:uncharacterized integral membrane protein
LSIRRATRAVVGSLLIAIGGLWALFFVVLLLWIWGDPNVGGYVFLSVMIALGMVSVVYGSVLCRRAFGSSSAAGPGSAQRHVAKSAVGVTLIALGSLWALLTLIVFVVYDGDPTLVTYAYFLGSAALGLAVAFLGGLLGRRTSSGS